MIKIKDKVYTLVGTTVVQRTNGIVKYKACKDATFSNGRKCDKTICNHEPKEYVWVRWPDGTICSYHENDLAAYTPDDPLTKSKPLNGNATKLVEKFTEMKKETAKEPKIDWTAYNGMYKIRTGESLDIKRLPIQESEMDWDKYHGFKKKKRSVR